MSKKLFILCTHGPEDGERAIIPFVMATAAQAFDVDVVMGFQAEGVKLASKQNLDKVSAPNFPAFADLVAAYIEGDGKMLVCGPCAKTYGIDPAQDFHDGAVVVGAATFVEEAVNANSSLVY
ncbi:MAG: DsrE family protein [Rhodospirillales bacterium]|nr:DsrE family protein [Rhodospirillales bacterium]